VTIFGTSGRAIADLSYGRFKAILNKFHSQIPSKLVIGRKHWIWLGNPVSSRQSASL